MPLSRLDFEIGQLTTATRLIAEGERRIAQQMLLIAGLRSRGLPTAESEKLLGLFVATLKQWNGHRDLIEEAIARLDQAPAPTSVPLSAIRRR